MIHLVKIGGCVNRRLWHACLIALLAPPVVAADFPTRPIRVIVPWPAGGSSDTIARVIGQRLTTIAGQQVVIDNRGGEANFTDGPFLESKEYMAGFWIMEAADLDVALGFHGAPGVHLPKIGVDRFTNYIQVHCVSFPFDQMTAMTSLVSGGVFDRHPKLRVAFLEAGVSWVPYFMDRMHEHWEKRGDWSR